MNGSIVWDRYFRVWSTFCCFRFFSSSGKVFCGDVNVFLVKVWFDTWFNFDVRGYGDVFFGICFIEVGVVYDEVGLVEWDYFGMYVILGYFCFVFLVRGKDYIFCWRNVVYLGIKVDVC